MSKFLGLPGASRACARNRDPTDFSRFNVAHENMIIAQAHKISRPFSAFRYRIKSRKPAFEKMSGISLMDLLIAIAIISILASIAYPAYRQQVLQGRTSNALSTLSILASRMESKFMDNRYYTLFPDVATCAIPAPVDDAFTFSCTTSGIRSQTFTWHVTDGTNTYTLNHLGERATLLFDGGAAHPNATACWQQNTSGRCY